MKTLYFATSNKWKFDQAKDYFANNGIDLQHLEIELPESKSEDVTEIAKEKAEFAFNKLRKPLFVIDAALCIKGLKDFPKTYVKFAEKYIRAEGILKLLEGNKNRNWEFPNIVYYKDEKQGKYFTGVIKGTVVEKLSHSQDSKVRDFDRIQIPEGHVKTFAEMTEEELMEFDNKVWKPVVFDSFVTWFKNET